MTGRYFNLAFLLLVLAASTTSAEPIPDVGDISSREVHDWFGNEVTLDIDVQKPGYRQISKDDEVIGAVFFSHQVKPVPAYSGKPIAVLVGMDIQGYIRGLKIVQHQEPILVTGVNSGDLDQFISQYVGINAIDNVLINAGTGPDYQSIDGITGATITAMVLNRTIMLSANAVAHDAGWLAARVSTNGSEVSGEAWGNKDSWRSWAERTPTIVIMAISLFVLLFILFFQDWLVRRTKLFRYLRTAYLGFTVVFIGYVFSAQISIVNILGFIQTFKYGFTWETLLLDPAIFLLWSFIAVSILLWGRGVFCGWLCPFGALQELVNKAAVKLNLPKWKIPASIHERMWAIKYFLLIGLIGLSLGSFETAAKVAEVEPFKTVFALKFAREWSYVAYALVLIGVSAVNSKFYCKYLCPLGAGLSFFGRFQIFDWLRRRKECGKPCQACAAMCQNGAIKPTGEIIANECHYCLDCQVTYWERHYCPKGVRRPRNKGRERTDADEEKVIKIIGQN